MKFAINKKTYNSKEIDFETFCQLEERGIEIEEVGVKKRLNTLKAFLSIWGEIPEEVASSELNNHIINKGTFDELNSVIDKEMNNSDFIQAILQQKGEVSQTEEAPQTEESPKVEETTTPQLVSETKSESTEA